MSVGQIAGKWSKDEIKWHKNRFDSFWLLPTIEEGIMKPLSLTDDRQES